MRIRRVMSAMAVGALLAIGGMAAPALAGGVSNTAEPTVTTQGWEYGD
ncbi:hypothetical protein AB0C50_28715 [Micromonospora taraxaci]|uniref:Uncharacterized protein n=1 Tax=Micromonospora taraxaci TaxID=1316803 RepID=A0A561VXT3_9ACTN|nr:hypothetical protein [Micromonospora taraxaci]TWG16420.1 hypothetical protein FHU34_111756 [Micromonospora taraxaci]